MAVYDIGPGHTYSLINTAHAVAVAAADPLPIFQLYGPHTETLQTITWALNNIRVENISGAYTLDGQNVTGAAFLETGADNFILEGNNLLVIENYVGAALNVIFFSGENNLTFRDFSMRGCGQVGVALRHLWINACNSLVVSGVTFQNSVDIGASAMFGVAITGVQDYIIANTTLDTLRTTGGVSYGISLDGASTNGLVLGNTLQGLVGSWLGIYALGPAVGVAGQASVLERNLVRGAVTGIYISRGTWQVRSNVAADCTSYGFRWRLAVPDPINPSCCVCNNTAYSSARGFYLDAHPALDVRNNIAKDCLSVGFWSNALGNVTSSNNTAHGCGTNFVAGWPLDPTDTQVDPLLVAPGAGDFSLQSVSPMIDSGATVASARYDLPGISRPQGVGYDRGAYEYPEDPFVAVLGAHFTNSSAGLTAHFVEVGNETNTTPASSVQFIENALTDVALATGTAGAVTVGTGDFGDTTNPFRVKDMGKYLYVYGAEPENSGFWLITGFDGPGTIETPATFVADMGSGTLPWAIFPSWSQPILKFLGNLADTGGKLALVFIPGALVAGTYYIKMENPGGETLTFRETTVTIP